MGRCSYFKGTDPLDPMNLEKHSAVRKAPKDPLGRKRYRLARFAAGSRLRWSFLEILLSEHRKTDVLTSSRDIS